MTSSFSFQKKSTPTLKTATPASTPVAKKRPIPRKTPSTLPTASSVQVGPDQQQVLYSVTDESGKTQQFMMLCPKDMDQNLLIQTLVKQIQSDPSTKGGRKTIKITQQKGALQKITGLPPGSRVVSQTIEHSNSLQKTQKATPQRKPVSATNSPVTAAVRSSPGKKTPTTPKTPQQQAPLAQSEIASINYLLANLQQPLPESKSKQVVEASELFESVVSDLPLEPADGSTRVYVKCNYCPAFKSSLNGDTWESILNHILPVAKEEIQTGFYGDLSKHFIRSLRVQVNGKQVVRKHGREIPQCEVVLTHSLVCRKTKREFIVSNPDANFVASLAKHIRMIQPGASGRGNSLLCIFCNSPFTHEDYIRHIQPFLDPILATLNTFAGAYCANLYDSTIRAARSCHICQESEAADLRFLPCTKFSNDYQCVKKLQFAIDCFREHYGDSGFLRLNTSTVAKCSVCKNSQQVYCAVFHISTTILGDEEGQQQDVDTQLAVCVNCQKQFINIVMKEQGFDERLKHFQLKNMEQLCSVLRVILSQATQICTQQRALIYAVHENMSNPNSSVHVVKNAEITAVKPVTKLLALAESEVAASTTKAFFICDLCLFTVDLTSLIAAEKERQKNEMLMSIVLEHLVPHTESLTCVMASTAEAAHLLSLKYEMLSRVQDMGPNNKKIVLSLQKKFKSPGSTLEVLLERDEDKTVTLLRTAAKAERKSFVALRKGASPSESSAASQLIEVNKFIDRQRGKLGILALSGCNTSLLNRYTECRLCSKYSFPDFRLAAGTASAISDGVNRSGSVELCENCVETVLTLCLPTEPECLQEADECLALGEPRLMGHRLVLSNNLKKWLSLDGVNLIKKTIDDFEEAKQADCSGLFTEALKRHCIAVLKTCQKDPDITCCSAGFCINNSFLNIDKEEKDETAAALASLEQQIGMPIKQAPPQLKPNEIQVTILSRRPKVSPTQPQKPKTPTLPAGYPRPRPSPSNGGVIKLGAAQVAAAAEKAKKAQAAAAAAAAAAVASSSDGTGGEEEESVSAIQNFLDATSGDSKKSPAQLRVPPGIKITSTGKGTVNIRAVSDKVKSGGLTATTSTTEALSRLSPSTTVTRRPVTTPASTTSTTSTTATPTKTTGGSTVTLTPNGLRKNKKDLSDDEGDSEEDKSRKASKRSASSTTSEDKEYKPPTNAEEKGPAAASPSDESTPTRSKRQRKEKKIFDL